MKHVIIRNPAILDGEPVIAGTRIPVVEFLLQLKEGHTIEDIHGMYPHVPETTFQGVLEELAETISAKSAQYAA